MTPFAYLEKTARIKNASASPEALEAAKTNPFVRRMLEAIETLPDTARTLSDVVPQLPSGSTKTLSDVVGTFSDVTSPEALEAAKTSPFVRRLLKVITKSAATEDAKTDPRLEEKDRKDAEALRNRHILLALKRALQGAAIGGVAGGMGAADPIGASDGLNASQGALLGLLGGGLIGGGVGAAEGGVRRSFGLDPLLETVATARRP
jgi:hypothetical protein